MDHERRAIFLIFAATLLMLTLAVVLGRGCAIAKAEWQKVDDFKGISTHSSPASMGWDASRLNVGWYITDGDLTRYSWDRLLTARNIGAGVSWMAPSPQDGKFLYSSGYLGSYSIANDTSTTINSGIFDTVHTYTGDSVAHRASGANNVTGSSWLKLTMTDMASVVIGSTLYPIRGFYNDTTLVLGSAIGTPHAVDTAYIAGPISVSSGPPGSFIDHDTAFVTDGTYLHYVRGDSTVTFSYPAVTGSPIAWFGTVDSVVGVVASGNRTDTVWAWANLPDSVVTAATHMNWLFSIDTCPRGIPAICDTAINSTTHDHIRLILDSAYYSVNGTTKIVNGAHALAFRSPDMHVLGTWTGGTMGASTIKGNVKYAVFTPSSTIPFANEVRDFDCNKVTVDGVNSSGRVFPQARVVNQSGIKILMWGPLTWYPKSGSIATTLTFYRDDKISTGGTSRIAWPYRISTLHRRRAWYANGDTLAWSGLNDYDNIAGTEVLEGTDPVTVLFSDGDQMVYGRRHKIGYVTGFSTTDFYNAPAPSGVGMVSQYSVALNPLDNCHIFLNELGLWKYCQGSVQEIPIDSRELFADSINWTQERNIWAVVYNHQYIFSAPFGTSTTNNRLVAVDLNTGATTFLGGYNPGAMMVRRNESGKEQLYLGCSDSATIYREGSADELSSTATMQSGWWDGGAGQDVKRVTSYHMDYETGSGGDTVFVDFYVGLNDSLSGTSAWTDTVVSTTAGQHRITAPVGRNVTSEMLSYGFRTTDNSVVILDFGWDAVDIGKGRGK